MTKKKTINLSNNRTVKKASIADLSVVIDFIEQGKAKMIKAGNPNQWSANYPAIETIERDIVQGDCYLLYEGGKAIATFVFKEGPEPNYQRIDDGSWLDDQPYYVIHRAASAEGVHGVMADVISYCSSFTSSIRIDTHADNRPMQASLARLGFVYCGVIYVYIIANRCPFTCFGHNICVSSLARFKVNIITWIN